MAFGDNLSVRGMIELALKGQGAAQAAKQLDQAKKSADQTKSSFKALETGSRELGSALTRYISVAAVSAAVIKSVTSSATLERAISAMRIQMKGMGIDAKTAEPLVLDMLAALRRGGAGLISETLPAFRTFLGLTNDLSAAMSLTRLASNMAESGFGGLAEAAGALSTIVSGTASARALKAWGINISDAADGTANATEALKAMHAAFPDSIADIEDMQNVIDKFMGATENLSANVGGLISRLFGGDPTAIGEASGAAIGKALAGGFSKALDVAGRSDAAKQRIKDAEAEEKARETAEKIADADFDVRQKLLEDVAALEKDASARQVGIRVQALMEARDRAVALYKAEGKDHAGIALVYDNEIAKVEREGAKRRSEIRQTELDEVRETYEEMLEGARKFSEEATEYFRRQADALMELYRVQLEQDGLTLDRREELQLKILDMEEQARLAEAKSVQEQDTIRQIYAARRVALARHIADTETQIQLQTAAAVVSLAQSLFGESKALAIAETIINSLAAAVAAFKGALQQGAPYWVAAILAASALAYGFAQVRQIEATDKKKEAFDVPAHDEMAYRMGRKSIQDFVRHTGEGMSAEIQRIGAAAQSALAGAGTGVQKIINFNAPVFGGELGIRQIRRKIERADRFDAPRMVR